MAKKIYQNLGLTSKQYQEILKILGRTPTSTELAMFSVEWSEHCGYPRSKNYLKTLPSHNHPSQVEPKQGSSTGVGGIIRDIVSMNAKPIALLDSLRFGNSEVPRNLYIAKGVISGIAFYGNCTGIPTVGGETYFNNRYQGNCLVNVFCLGIAKEKDLIKNSAQSGDLVLVLGARTGRDGIGGCSILASAEFKEEDKKRPTVQIGDPFKGKCLIEATLEAFKTGGISAFKDMGAAGLTCTTSELSFACNCGMEIELSKVPLREEGMEPFEIMMSESQERMLAIVKTNKVEEIIRIFHKWNLEAEVIGKVIKEKKIIIKNSGKISAELPVKELTNPSIIKLRIQMPEYLKTANVLKNKFYKEKINYKDTFLNLLGSPNISSKSWVWEEYDYMVQTNTVIRPGEGDAAVIRIKEANFALGITCDGNSRYTYLNPYLGAQIAVAEAARNLVCVGAAPAALTDCLNFGNPEKPDRFWQFVKAVEGIAKASKFLKIAVVSGNVSFYNENPKNSIYPTPIIGMVGIIDDLNNITGISFKNIDDLIVLIGELKDELGGSEYLKIKYNLEQGGAPKLDLNYERRIQKTCLDAIKSGMINSAHDCSIGGLLTALAESCILGNLGAQINLEKITPGVCFGESQSRIIISLKKENFKKLKKIAFKNKVNLVVLGKVIADKFSLNSKNKEIFNLDLNKIKEKYFSGNF
ncbi:MAG: phosphoribosylformylglycinamidine synthase subunit PurL [Armatimonadetes bacterium]|nr:phosphoribosylformylglycinamidine synthase subunit PurL [Armatimonadota bacterium]